MSDEAGQGPGAELLYARLLSLEERMDELTVRVGNLVDRMSETVSQSQPVQAPSSAENSLFSKQELTPGLTAVIRLVAQGRADESEARLRELPPEELAGNPAVVAIVAAVLCIQRNDYKSALKALNRARQLTDDDRLLKVLSLVEAQMG